MTVNTVKITSGPYAGNDVADQFSYTFRINNKSEIYVWETTGSGDPVLLTVDTDYTVAGIGDDGGGLITRTAGALPTGSTWYIRSNFESTQLTEFSSQGAFFPDVHEDQFDKTILLIQQLEDGLRRTLKFDDSYSGNLDLDIPAPESLKLMRWKSDETGLENIEITEINPNFITTGDIVTKVDTYTGLRALTTAQVWTYVIVGGALSATDGGGGVFRLNTADGSSADNGYDILVDASNRRWYRVYDGKVYAEMFGITPSLDVSTSTTRFNSAFTTLAGKTLHLRDVRYKYSGEVTATQVSLCGTSRPTFADDLGTLEGGSVIVGSMTFRSVRVSLANFGVDHGIDEFPATAANALVASPTVPDSGDYVRVDNVIGLTRDPSDAFHATLFEGFKYANVSNVIGIRSFFGCVVKAAYANVSGIHAIEPSLFGLIVKSDTTSGILRRVNVSDVTCDGRGVTGLVCEIQSFDSQLQELNINGVEGRDVGGLIRVAGTVIANEVNISNVSGSVVSADAIRQTGTCYQLNISNVAVAGCEARAGNFESSRFLNVSNFSASAASTGSPNINTDFIQVSAGCNRVALNNVNLSDNYDPAVGNAGMIKFDNTRGRNECGQGYYRITGVGAPVTQVIDVTVDPGASSAARDRETYRVAQFLATWAGTTARQFNLLNNNVKDGWQVRIDNTMGFNLVIARSDGSGPITTLNTGQYGLFVFDGVTREYLLMTKAAI